MRRLAELAVRAYHFDAPTLQPISSTENAVFAVDTAGGERYVLRIHRPTRDPAKIRSELVWLAALRRDTDLLVPDPVRLADGEWVGAVASADLPDQRCFVAFRWIPGQLVSDRLDRSVFHDLGQLLARLHDHARGFDGGPDFVRGRMDDQSYRPEELPASLSAPGLLPEADRRLVRDSLALVREQVSAVGTGVDLFGLVHADLHQYNCVDSAGRLAPIDFDDCGYAHFAYDLAVPIVMTAERSDGTELAEGLVDGYRAASTSAGDPTEHLQTFVVARRIHLLGWIADNLPNPELAAWARSFVPASLADLRRYVGAAG
jgi:Ser/Thr protein kinase RdoA (MazF antagonist)